MNMIPFFNLMLFFFVYSFIGWVCECIYCSVPQKQFVNRGFLTGPVCPVYGFGALLVLFLLRPFSAQPVMLFISGIVITSVLEYITSVILEKLFHMKWWDYSEHSLNINGRVCLLNSMLFGVMSVILVLFIHPRVGHLIKNMSLNTVLVVGSSLTTLLIVDLVVSICSILKLNGKLPEIHAAINGLVEKNRTLLESKLLHRRLLHAFPHLKSERYHGTIEQLRETIREMRLKKKEK